MKTIAVTFFAALLLVSSLHAELTQGDAEAVRKASVVVYGMVRHVEPVGCCGEHSKHPWVAVEVAEALRGKEVVDEYLDMGLECFCACWAKSHEAHCRKARYLLLAQEGDPKAGPKPGDACVFLVQAPPADKVNPNMPPFRFLPGTALDQVRGLLKQKP